MAKTKQSSFSRRCPLCDVEIFYSTKGNLNLAIRKNGSCQECYFKNRDHGGDKNPFYGKHHNESSKEKIRNMDRSFTQTLSFKEKAIETLKLSWSDGKSCYDHWFEKYGKEIADQKLLEIKKKHSINNTGAGNPMYGKPPTKGTGDGWSGWYKGWYFRSLLELSYVVGVLEPLNIKWESAEKSYLGMPYKDLNDNAKMYFADFLIDGYLLTEIKPKKLINSPKVLAKRMAAEEFCKQNTNFSYQILTPEYLDSDTRLKLYNDKTIIFTSKSEKQFLKYHKL
jgi:hypothetical protein